MSKLWIYGCSFSEPYGLTKEFGVVVAKDGTRDFGDAEYWGTHLAKKLNVEVVNKAFSAMGWNYINHHIDLDILKWNKNDIIIISPSFLSRINIMEFEEGGVTVKEYVHLLKNISEIMYYNELRWKTKIKTLQHFGYNIFTWLVDYGTNSNNDVKNLVKTPEGSTNFKDWMDLHLEYWTDLTRDVYPEGDWHFNKIGHLALSEVMYEFIKDKIDV